MKKKYKYVSYVFGGFEKIHEESIRYHIPLLDHDENCFLCKKKNPKISELLKDKEVKKSNTAINFFFGRKESDGDKNKNKNKKEIKKISENINKNIHNNNSNDMLASSNSNDKPRNSGNFNTTINNNSNNKEKKEGFFSKLFGSKKNSTKNETNPESNRKISNDGNIQV